MTRAITIGTGIMMFIIMTACTKNGLTGYDIKIKSSRDSSFFNANGAKPQQRPDSINISEAHITSSAAKKK